MERELKGVGEEVLDHEQAKKEIWKYILGFAEMAVVKCAVELKIADAIESHGNPMTLPELASTLGCSASHLHRIMRFLVHRGIFKETATNIVQSSPTYSQTPLSRLLMRSGQHSMGSFILLESLPPMLAPWHGLSSRVQGGDSSAFEAANGEDYWSYAAANPAVNQLINDAMACNARLNVDAIVDKCKDLFQGVETVVDVGGGNGTTMGMLIKAFPWIRGINFDLPHVINDAKEFEGVENVGGDMFDSVPKADVVFIMSVLHDWGDEECIKVLKKCKEAIPEEKGKVIIVDAVIENEKEKEEDGLSDARLRLDIAMMAHTITGRERTMKEWEYILVQAGFNRHIVRPIDVVPSVIEAFP
ncbi:acetylserotonin O-methyltransferase-like [Ziziphus jujuba]|nr:acetylserotonin O-methyltransferase-like [Ziziphus jujuba var. spinosa]XP_060667508.1 acetylserotonin O-methyltransferase-like [Ziziphus jujuba]XP_060667509.1 acetylserotonin O-methyltransferase-like [Ziziphus jujuba]XP_060667510.1 acetylserotonin O-methyltransferase-like [Ziziphus jujuba]XP_060667511.1 acetylserotonin O-methyltransferase-like [Ziziphus jujuba]XP_060667512.1 acetylserotonin O-methyltransferase-like [Ziziphus jujuba]XP_060667513.1 acetylserotonin O-methyltransferase-like [Z